MDARANASIKKSNESINIRIEMKYNEMRKSN